MLLLLSCIHAAPPPPPPPAPDPALPSVAYAVQGEEGGRTWVYLDHRAPRDLPLVFEGDLGPCEVPRGTPKGWSRVPDCGLEVGPEGAWGLVGLEDARGLPLAQRQMWGSGQRAHWEGAACGTLRADSSGRTLEVTCGTGRWSLPAGEAEALFELPAGELLLVDRGPRLCWFLLGAGAAWQCVPDPG